MGNAYLLRGGCRLRRSRTCLAASGVALLYQHLYLALSALLSGKGLLILLLGNAMIFDQVGITVEILGCAPYIDLGCFNLRINCRYISLCS
jgi:hypothetical protein